MTSASVYPSQWLKAEDLDGDLEVTITKVRIETVGQGRDAQDKPVIYFHELAKGVVLNKTNWSLIAKQHGDESDDWTDKKIVLTVMDVDYKGDMVAAIRVRLQRKVSANVAAVQPATPLVKSDDTDVVTEFWTLAKQNGYERKDGVALLKAFDGDFAKAVAGLKSGDLPF